jgi:glycosyltransferase involved in cell wall biosynthesis
MADISVIIPVKNRAKLLRATLRNLQNQSQPPDEIIVVNDHSTDDFQLLVMEHLTDAIFINNKGSGPGAARNTGLEVATGRYIQFFDSDDLLTKNKIKAQFDALESSGADMAYGPYVQAYEKDAGIWEQKDVVMQAASLPGSQTLEAMLYRGWNILTQACMFRREVIEKAGKWNEKLITHEDYLYFLSLSKFIKTMVHVPVEAVIYRQHGQQSTENLTNQLSRTEDKIEVLIAYLQEMGQRKLSWFDKICLLGRLHQTVEYYRQIGGDARRFSGYTSVWSYICQHIYRVYNKQQRMKTGTLWETMHGVSADKALFDQIIKNIA